MAVSSERSVVRTAGRRARRDISGEVRTSAEAALIGHLMSLAALGSGTVGVFVAHDGEPDLTPLVHSLWECDVLPALPVLLEDPDDYSMRFIPWHRGQALAPGRYEIPVPPVAPAVVPDTLLVSFTGFDSSGNRIGRGGGFFDRYLNDYPGTVIGVGFEAQRMAAVPVAPHDQPLGTVVTDLGVRFIQ